MSKIDSLNFEKFDAIVRPSNDFNRNKFIFNKWFDSEEITKVVCKFVEENKVSIAIKNVTAKADFSNNYITTLVILDKYGKIASDIMYIDDNEIRTISLDRMNYNKGIDYLKKQIILEETKKEVLPFYLEKTLSNVKQKKYGRKK